MKVYSYVCILFFGINVVWLIIIKDVSAIWFLLGTVYYNFGTVQ